MVNYMVMHQRPRFTKPAVLVAVIFALVGIAFMWRSFAANPNLPGDVNNDNKVTITDLSILLSNFGKPSATADLNGDGQVTITDLSILLTNFGRTYGGNPNPNPNPVPPFTIAAAGDIAVGGNEEKRTAALITSDSSIEAVLALGDLAYESGTTSDFNNKYNPSWGVFKSKTKPTPGNHEYYTSGASGYFNYFNNIAEYYSFDIKGWHFISLNSNIARTATSTQVNWLKADLAKNTSKCTLAFWHHPRFSSGDHSDNSSVQPFFQALYDANADLVLTGHSHLYERYAPSTPTGGRDADRGIRNFVVGTGGADLDGSGSTGGPIEKRDNTKFGVIKLTLSPESYTWKFVDTGGTVRDEGSGTCH